MLTVAVGQRVVPRAPRLHGRAGVLRRPTRRHRRARDHVRGRAPAAGRRPTSRGPSRARTCWPTTCTTVRRSTPGGAGTSGTCRSHRPDDMFHVVPLYPVRTLEFDTSLLEPYVGPAVTPAGGARARWRSWPRRPDARSSTSARTSSAGSGSPCRARRRARSGSVTPRCWSTTSWASGRCATPRRPTGSSSAAATDVFEPTKTFHGFRYAEVTGWPGASSPRTTWRRSSSTPTCGGPAGSSARTRCSTSSTGTSSGGPRATSSTCPPTARSATSGSAGPATSPRSRPPRRTSSTSRTFLADWLRRPGPRAGARRRMVAFVVPDVLKLHPATRGVPRAREHGDLE